MSFLEVAALFGLVGGTVAGTFTITWAVAKELFQSSGKKTTKKIDRLHALAKLYGQSLLLILILHR